MLLFLLFFQRSGILIMCPAVQLIDRLYELAALRRIAVRRRGNSPQQLSEETKDMPKTVSQTAARGSGSSGEVRMRTYQAKMELLRRREESLLADGQSEVMQLLLARPLHRASEAAAAHKDEALSVPAATTWANFCHLFVPAALSDTLLWRGWVSVSVVLGKEGQLLCVVHSMEGLERSTALDLGRLVPGQSRYRFMSAEELGRIGLGGCQDRMLWGYELLVFPSSEGERVIANTGLSVEKAPATGRLVVLATGIKDEFDELHDAVMDCLRPTNAVGVVTTSSGALSYDSSTLGPSSSETKTERDNRDFATAAGQARPVLHMAGPEATSLMAEIRRMRAEVARLTAENRNICRDIIRVELRLLDLAASDSDHTSVAGPQPEPGSCAPLRRHSEETVGMLRLVMSPLSEAVPRLQLEEACALAASLEEESRRVKAGMRAALGLLEGIGAGLPLAL